MYLRKALVISGLSYLMIFITGFYANFSILETMVVSDNVEVTVANFIGQRTRLGSGILAFLGMLIFDVVLVFSLYPVTKQTNRKLTIVASVFRMLHAIGFGIALISLIRIYHLTDSPGSMDVIELEDSIMHLLEKFDSTWTLGLLFFGIHLAFLGYLSVKSAIIPKSIGYLLLLAALGYLVSCSAKLVLTVYTDYEQFFESMVVLFGVVGEFSFTIWLFIKGLKKAQ
ncbi:MAG: DUF4386 domain-containing protein [Bacteroidota bacterium]|uniref:DUF4386 domain-containing protein n=1 Tax=Flagellimonas profundi TaxID=2915620 RepID=A0ABS3FB81_9FLAO|nr:DUF4386 domain-containing protein [Allomuricauda profundi]MBO0340416.1 DUF4386 domain-containing protein [Allomuricauda profundi]MEC7770288.1 DUF4386 domain-containing protein [Bacteroidota bacterium]